MLETGAVARIVGAEVRVVIKLPVGFELTGAEGELAVGARAILPLLTVFGLTTTVPLPALGVVLLNKVRSCVLLDTDTIGDVAVWVMVAAVTAPVTGTEPVTELRSGVVACVTELRTEVVVATTEPSDGSGAVLPVIGASNDAVVSVASPSRGVTGAVKGPSRAVVLVATVPTNDVVLEVRDPTTEVVSLVSG